MPLTVFVFSSARVFPLDPRLLSLHFYIVTTRHKCKLTVFFLSENLEVSIVFGFTKLKQQSNVKVLFSTDSLHVTHVYILSRGPRSLATTQTDRRPRVAQQNAAPPSDALEKHIAEFLKIPTILTKRQTQQKIITTPIIIGDCLGLSQRTYF